MLRIISIKSDSSQLQKDVDTLQQWEQDWVMEACGDQHSGAYESYYINGPAFLKEDTAKYLGIHLSKNQAGTTS